MEVRVCFIGSTYKAKSQPHLYRCCYLSARLPTQRLTKLPADAQGIFPTGILNYRHIGTNCVYVAEDYEDFRDASQLEKYSFATHKVIFIPDPKACSLYAELAAWSGALFAFGKKTRRSFVCPVLYADQTFINIIERFRIVPPWHAHYGHRHNKSNTI